MPNTSHSITAVIALVAPMFIAGCSKPTAPVSSGTPAAQSSSSSPAAAKGPEDNLTTGFVFGESQKIPNPDAATIEKHLRATDWKNAQQRPLLHVTKNSASGSTTVKLEGTLGTPNEDGPFHATVIGLGSDGKGGLRIVLAAESKPLETIDAALELLTLMQSDPDKFRETVGEWPDATVVK